MAHTEEDTTESHAFSDGEDSDWEAQLNAAIAKASALLDRRHPGWRKREDRAEALKLASALRSAGMTSVRICTSCRNIHGDEPLRDYREATCLACKGYFCNTCTDRVENLWAPSNSPSGLTYVPFCRECYDRMRAGKQPWPVPV